MYGGNYYGTSQLYSELTKRVDSRPPPPPPQKPCRRPLITHSNVAKQKCPQVVAMETAFMPSCIPYETMCN